MSVFAVVSDTEIIFSQFELSEQVAPPLRTTRTIFQRKLIIQETLSMRIFGPRTCKFVYKWAPPLLTSNTNNKDHEMVPLKNFKNVSQTKFHDQGGKIFSFEEIFGAVLHNLLYKRRFNK